MMSFRLDMALKLSYADLIFLFQKRNLGFGNSLFLKKIIMCKTLGFKNNSQNGLSFQCSLVCL